MDANPGFVNPGNGDWHLSNTSCLIGTGTNSPLSVNLPELDIDLQARIGGQYVDIGADEYYPEE